MGSNRDWELWGAQDPYYGVVSDERFRTATMSATARDEFFASGEAHVAQTIDRIRDVFDPNFTPQSAMDFGSGVGRLVIPLARRMPSVTGVDISPSMIAEAQKNCQAAGTAHVRFVLSDDNLSRLDDAFDLVHSYIVLQHVPWQRGRQILQAMAAHVKPGGYLAVQILTGCTAPVLLRALVKLRYVFPPANWVRNLLRSRPMFEQAMQLHVYDLATVQRDLEQRGFKVVLVPEPWTAAFNSTIIYAAREKQGSR